MTDKIQNLKDLEYYSNMLLSTGLIKKWIDMKPDNPELKKLSKVLVANTFYVMNLQEDLAKYKILVSDYRYAMNKAKLELQELKEKKKEYEI